MLETSKDLLYIILAVSIGTLTIFVCWLVYYLISIVRDVKNITDGINDKVKKVDAIIDKIHEKIEKTSSNVGLLTEVAKRGISVFLDYQKGRKNDDVYEESKKKRRR